MSIPSSTIILYKDSKIIPSRNFVVDSLADYLSSLSKLTISSFQYQRHHLEMEIKIDKTQVWQEFEALNNYNYLSIQNSDSSRVVYYFITGKRQLAQDTIALKLYMDTANTFKWNVDFTPTNRTKVVREHKDRLVKGEPAQVQLLIENADSSSISLLPNSYYVELEDTYSSETLVITGDVVGGLALDPSEQGNLVVNLTSDDARAFFENTSGYLRIGYRATSFVPLTTRNIFLRDQTITKYYYTRVIDYYSEGLEAPLYKTELGELSNQEGSSWNLVYQNDSADAIQCFIIPTATLQTEIPASSSLTYTDFEDGAYYHIVPFKINGEYQIVVLTDNNNDTYKTSRPDSLTITGYTLRRTGTTLKIRKETYQFGDWNFNRNMTGTWTTITSISFDVDILYYRKNNEDNVSALVSNGSFSASSSTYASMDTLQDVDRVDADLIKIISIPYFPSYKSYDSANNSVAVDSTWTWTTSLHNAFRLNDLNTHFTATIDTTIDNPLNIFTISFVPSNTDARNDIYESKLFHSDYYQPKFVYDSFGFVFELEKIDVDNFAPSNKFTFEFVMTSTINSKFMFKFPEYVLKMSTQDYDNILTVARNNEAPIYNSAYITYLRTAYRYDLKQLDWRNETRIQSLAEGTIQRGIMGAVGGGAGIFNAYFGQISATLGIINSAQTDQLSMEARRESLKHQANSVRGSDDLDLLENYSNNRAKLVLYQVSPRMKELLADFFYYFGYTTNELKIPTLTTRLWFNYVQCELETLTTGNNIPEELMDNIKQRYSSGITFLHKVSGGWNFEQDKENWEVSIL